MTHPSDRDEDHVPRSYGHMDREAHHGIPEGFRTLKEGSLSTARLAFGRTWESGLHEPVFAIDTAPRQSAFRLTPTPLPRIVPHTIDHRVGSRSSNRIFDFFDHLDIDHPGSTTKSGVL